MYFIIIQQLINAINPWNYSICKLLNCQLSVYNDPQIALNYKKKQT